MLCSQNHVSDLTVPSFAIVITGLKTIQVCQKILPLEIPFIVEQNHFEIELPLINHLIHFCLYIRIIVFRQQIGRYAGIESDRFLSATEPGCDRKMDKLLIFQQRPADQFRHQGIALIQRLGLLYISVAVYTSHKIKPLVIIAVAHPQFPGISQRFIRSSIGHKTKIRRSYPGISERLILITDPDSLFTEFVSQENILHTDLTVSIPQFYFSFPVLQKTNLGP